MSIDLAEATHIFEEWRRDYYKDENVSEFEAKRFATTQAKYFME